MIKIGLLTMPQSTLAFPSIGLTQIASVLRKQYGEAIEADIYYPCLDFAEFIGLDNFINMQPSGLIQWLFRKEAFPTAEDNIDTLKKFLFGGGSSRELEKMFNTFLELREKINDYLDLIIKKYKLLECDIVGISSCFSQNIPSFALARKLKEKNPSCITVIGGPNCDYPMGKSVIDHIEPIDYVFSGPGIVPFIKFIGSILEGDMEAVHKINGVFTKKNNVIGHQNNKNLASGDDYWVNQRGDYHDINICIELDYDSYIADFEAFKRKTNFPFTPTLLFETGRGCWKRDGLACTFCGLNDPEICFESMKPELAIGYIQKLVDRYADNCDLFYCIDNILDKKYVKEVFPFLKLPNQVWLEYETSSTLSKELMEICAECGVKFLQPGIESFNTDELKLMQKAVTSFINLQFLKHCIEVGIYPVWNYLYGVPGNTEDANYDGIEQLLPMVRHLPPPSSLSPISFARYSIFQQNAEKYELELIPDDYTASIYPFSDSVNGEFVYSFYDINENTKYREIANRYVPDINFEIVEWISSYRYEDDLPKLYFCDEYKIFDSRFDIDDPDEYEISELEKKILVSLNKPKTLNQLKNELCEVPGMEVVNAFEKLKKNNLLFSENYKYLNLVCFDYKWDKAGFNRLLESIIISTTSAF